jgi:xanthine dehydrogenase YagR molybdenum-binding subunit
MATESVIPAVLAAADNAIAWLLTVAVTTPGSPFAGHQPEELALEGGLVFAKKDGPANGVSFQELLRGASIRQVTGNGKSEGTVGNLKPGVNQFLRRQIWTLREISVRSHS